MRLIKNFILDILIVVLIFLYLYPLLLKAVPLGLSSRLVLTLAGIVIWVIQLMRSPKPLAQLKISKEDITLSIILCSIGLVAFIAVVFNSSIDYELVKYPVSMLFVCFGTLTVVTALKKRYGSDLSTDTLANFIVLVVLIQVLIAFLMFINPGAAEFFNNLQVMGDDESSKLENVMKGRFVGFGSKFFGAGIINGFALICIAYLLAKKRQKSLLVTYYSLAFLLIAVLGMMMARTTIIGVILAILYLFVPIFKRNISTGTNGFKFVMNLVFVPILIFTFLSVTNSSILKDLEEAFNFGFEVFINYSKSGDASSESTDQLKEMYIYPDKVKTYLIGDAKFYTVLGQPDLGYYMNTDVGYFRLLFYFGLPGLFVMLLLQYQVIREAFKDNITKYFGYCLFAYCLILNFKGFADLFPIIMLFYLSNREQSSEQTDPLSDQ